MRYVKIEIAKQEPIRLFTGDSDVRVVSWDELFDSYPGDILESPENTFGERQELVIVNVTEKSVTCIQRTRCPYEECLDEIIICFTKELS